MNEKDTPHSPSFTTAQVNARIVLAQFDFQLLLQLVHVGINDIRQTKGAKPLANHQILQKAALDHNNYQIATNKMTHSQRSKEKKTVKDRIEIYGGGFSMMGENVQYSGFPVQTWSGSKRKEILCPTYQEAAKAIVKNWVDSPGHYKNLIHPDYRYVGTAVGWSDKKNAVFATQVFGR